MAIPRRDKKKGVSRFRWLLLTAAVVLSAFMLFLAWAHEDAIPPITAPARDTFDPSLIDAGANLARIGNCVSCHQARHGRPYAGGYGVDTPFGTVYGTNITPDLETGIGRWSQQAFDRAMREGVSRDGHHLYPAFPYDHFARLSDRDLHALYAFLMTRDPVKAQTPSNRLWPPLDFRPLLAGWKALFLRPLDVPEDRWRAGAWNRGAYLAEALAHCSGCHSPRGALGEQLRDRAYDGGWSGGWYAPSLNTRSPAVRAWTEERLFTYLATGLSAEHAAAAGPMGPITHNLARANPEDVRAIAAYFAWRMRDAPAARAEPTLLDRASLAQARHPLGASLFAGACAACHEPGALMMVEGRPALPLASSMHLDTPHNAIRIILEGLTPPVRAAGPFMPAFADTFTDVQIADIVAYMRTRYGPDAPWPDLKKNVARAREGKAP